MLTAKKIILLKSRWSPTRLGQLAAWWNADDLVTGAVTTWTDRIGGLAPTQGTGSLQPVKAATSFNSAYGGVTFDGTDDFLLIANTGSLPTGTASSEIHALATSAALAADATIRSIFSYGGPAANAGRRLGRTSSGTVNQAHVIDVTTALTDNGVTNPFNSSAIVSGKWDAATEYGFMQGLAFSTPSTADSFSTTTTRSTIGGSTAASPSTLFWNGVIRHIFVIAGVLSTADRQRLEGWMAWDTNLTSLLPVGHPYKLQRP